MNEFLSLFAISSSSPPQPQNMLLNPFTSLHRTSFISFQGYIFYRKNPPPTLPTLYQECNLRGFLLTWGENPNYFWVNNKHFQKSPKQICPKFISSKNSIHPKGWNKYVKILILNQDQIIVLNLFWVKDKFHMDKICDRTITR